MPICKFFQRLIIGGSVIALATSSFLLYLLFNYLYTHTLFSSEVRCLWNQKSSYATYLLWLHLSTVHAFLCATGGTAIYLLRSLSGFGITCVMGPYIKCSISRCQQALVESSSGIFFKFQYPPRCSTSQTASQVAVAWWFIYLYSTLSKKDLKQVGVQQIFVEWLQATLSCQIFSFFLFFHNKQNHHNIVTFFGHIAWGISVLDQGLNPGHDSESPES